MRATIKATNHNRATVTADNPFTGEREVTEYFAPSYGGYVRVDDGSRYPQVCDGLSSRGSTLSWGGREPLVDLIRREWRRGRRDR